MYHEFTLTNKPLFESKSFSSPLIVSYFFQITCPNSPLLWWYGRNFLIALHSSFSIPYFSCTPNDCEEKRSEFDALEVIKISPSYSFDEVSKKFEFQITHSVSSKQSQWEQFCKLAFSPVWVLIEHGRGTIFASKTSLINCLDESPRKFEVSEVRFSFLS